MVIIKKNYFPSLIKKISKTYNVPEVKVFSDINNLESEIFNEQQKLNDSISKSYFLSSANRIIDKYERELKKK